MIHRLRCFRFLVFSVCAVGVSGLAHAQSDFSTRRLSSSAQADMEVRMQQMEGEVRTLRGAVEQQTFYTQKLTKQLERLQADLELRFDDLAGADKNSGPSFKGGLNPADKVEVVTKPAPMKKAAPVLSPPTAPRLGTLGTARITPSMVDSRYPEEVEKKTPMAAKTLAAPEDAGAILYENAFAQLKQSHYEGAEKGFLDFLKLYPKHRLTPNAKYWLGESYYVRGNFERAARIFAEGFQLYPDASKAPDNLLKLGLSLAGMGNKDDACLALKQLKEPRFRNTGPVTRRADQEMLRLGCSE